MRVLPTLLFSNLALCVLLAQEPVQRPAPPANQPAQTPGAGDTQDTVQRPERALRPDYVLGTGDIVTIRVRDDEEVNGTFRVDSDGNLNLPQLGKVYVQGLTVEQLENDLKRLLTKYVVNPILVVSLTQFRAEPIFLVGNFVRPGIISMQGRMTLLEVLTGNGGLQVSASRIIKVTRHLEMGTIPLPNAVTDNERKTSTAEINTDDLRNNVNPAENIVLEPMDSLIAERAEPVYVMGEVAKVGGVELVERDSISMMQLITSVGGLQKDAAPQNARVLRKILNTSRRAEIPVDLKQIMAGKVNDFPLLPGDVLYVPRSSKSAVLSKVGIIALPAATALIYVLATRL